MKQIKVLLCDDDPLVRHALRGFCEASEDIHVVAEAADGEEAVHLADSVEPDIVIMDLNLPGTSGVDATQTIIAAENAPRVLAITTLGTERTVVSAFRAGASGFLLKSADPDILLRSIRQIDAGCAVITPDLTRELVASLRRDTQTSDAVSTRAKPTDRELSIVQLLARGLSNGEIAETLFLSEATIKSNLTRLMRKWDVRDRLQVLVRAVESGVIDPDSMTVDR